MFTQDCQVRNAFKRQTFYSGVVALGGGCRGGARGASENKIESNSLNPNYKM